MAEDNQPENPEHNLAAPFSDCHVLIVDDSATQLELLRFLMEKAGYVVTMAADGAQALALMEKSEFSLVISDIVMPVMNGYELCGKIKRDPNYQNIPVMLLTRLADVEDIIVGLEAQADYYVTKPYSEEFLLSRVRLLLRRNREEEVGEDEHELLVTLAGKSYTVSAERKQILNFLVSTYDNAIQRNRELYEAQRDLRISNQLLSEQTAKAQVAETNYFRVLHQNPDAMIVLDQQNRVCFLNAAASELLSEDKSVIAKIIDAIPESVNVATELEIPRHDGRIIVAEVRVVETIWAGEPANLAALRDISIRKRAEQKIREQQQQLHEANLRLQQLASLDAMTGLPNFRAFKERFEEEVSRSLRYHLSLSLLLFDIDRFKSYNDDFGHPAGDELLASIGSILQAHVRNNDFPARYGGEEFVILLPNTDAVGAVDMAERLRVALETAEWKRRSITASFGVATLDENVNDGIALLSAADTAMYQSKFGGRNRVTHFQDIL